MGPTHPTVNNCNRQHARHGQRRQAGRTRIARAPTTHTEPMNSSIALATGIALAVASNIALVTGIALVTP